MALHNLVITVVDGGKTSNFVGQEKESEQTKETQQGQLESVFNYNQLIKNKIKQEVPSTTFFGLEMGAQIAKKTLLQTANFYISDIGRRNGDSNYQAQVNRTVEIVGDVMSVGTGALSGAATGSMFGPVGTLVGAVMGVASSAVNIAFKYAERDRAYQHERFKENTSQAYNLTRANYSVWTGRAR